MITGEHFVVKDYFVNLFHLLSLPSCLHFCLNLVVCLVLYILLNSLHRLVFDSFLYLSVSLWLHICCTFLDIVSFRSYPPSPCLPVLLLNLGATNCTLFYFFSSAYISFLTHDNICDPFFCHFLFWYLPCRLVPLLVSSCVPALSIHLTNLNILWLLTFFVWSLFVFNPLPSTSCPHGCLLVICLSSALGGLPSTPAAGVPCPPPAGHGHRGQAHQTTGQLFWSGDPKDGRLSLWGGH